MSELQSSLLIIGIAVVLAVYAYNAWQQRQYRRKPGTIFKHRQQEAKQTPASEALAPVADMTPSEIPPAAADNNCALLDDATDYIATLTVRLPVGADALARLWNQRFDFGKNIYICGLNAANGTWEKVIAEGRDSYSQFNLALQLVSRAGPVSEGRLSGFRDLVRLIATSLQAEARLPDVTQAAARAQQLDKFCAEVDQMIGLNILPAAGQKFSTRELQHAAEEQGMQLQPDGWFHLLDEHGNTLFKLGNIDNTPLPHTGLPAQWLDGVTLVLDLPNVTQPVSHFDQMAALTQSLASELDGTVTDDRHATLNPHSIALIREQIVAIEARMVAKGFAPGSAKARRLFS